MLENFEVSDLKSYSIKELENLSKEIRKEIIDSTNKNGGHLSSNLGVVELTIALHKHYNFPNDKLLFDVGHQCYAHKILTNRDLSKLRKENGISGFPKKNESIYDCFEGGHSSNSISNALGMAISRDLNNDKYNIITLIGDASISNGLAFEALNDTNLRDHKVIIILNDNGMAISQNVGNISQLFSKVSTSGLYNKTKLAYKRFASKSKTRRKIYESLFNFKSIIKKMLLRGNYFSDLGLNYIGVVDGHNFKALEKAFKKADKSIKSTVIHVKTIKGLGYKEAENDKLGHYHAVSSKEKELNTLSWSEFYSLEFEHIIEENKNTILISPATLVGSHFDYLSKKYKDRIIDVGIAEEHAFSMAAGLSYNKYKPYISIYSTFLQRAFDELSHDCAREKFNITCLIDRCGLNDGDGDTHQGIFDEGFLINTPNTVVAMANNSDCARFLLNDTINDRGVYCIRYPKGEIFDSNELNSYSFGKWNSEISNNSKTLIISFGPILNKLKKYIIDNHLNIDLVNAIFQKPLDIDYLKSIKEKYDNIIIYNVYSTKEGFNNYLLDELNTLGFNSIIKSFALPLSFENNPNIDHILESYKLDIKSVIKEAI